MAWLVREGTVIASLEVAGTRRARRRGLLGRDAVDGALLLRPCRSVHTIGMRMPIDVAHCRPERDGEGPEVLRVVRTCTMRPGRVGLPVWGSGAVLESAAGSLVRWGVQVGDEMEVRS